MSIAKRNLKPVKQLQKPVQTICAKMFYNAKKRAEKIAGIETETILIKSKPIQELKAKGFLTVRESSVLLNCSIRSVYNYI